MSERVEVCTVTSLGEESDMSVLNDHDCGVVVEEMTPESGRVMLNRLATKTLGISGDEFLRRLDEGEYDDSEEEDVFRLRMLAPFGR